MESPTTYEANPDSAYNLIRTGKILEMVESSYNPAAKEVMQSLLLLGQTRISDLKAAYEEKIRHWNETAKYTDEDVEMSNGTSKKSQFPVKSIAHLNSIICRLAEAELIDVVHNRTFHSPDDIRKDVENQVLKAKFPDGVKGGKAKVEYDTAVAQELRKVRRESKSLKRKLEENGGSGAKRRKLLNGAGTNGVHEGDIADPLLDVSMPPT
jgi:DNA-directed RNA polymerase III subunit RPC3